MANVWYRGAQCPSLRITRGRATDHGQMAVVVQRAASSRRLGKGPAERDPTDHGGRKFHFRVVYLAGKLMAEKSSNSIYVLPCQYVYV